MPKPRLAFHLLGSPQLELDGAPIQVDTRKAIALAIYLGLTGEAQARDRLAALFWPEADEAKAHAALRRTLSVLNKALAGIALHIERETVTLERGAGLWLDVNEFQRLLQQCRTHGHPAHEICGACLQPLSQAVALYRDDFLSGFTLRDSPAFDDWQFFQSESLRRELAEALEKLARCYSEAGQHKLAITHTRRWLALDPMHEPAHRQLMALYAQAGQRSAALRQYQECLSILDKELGVPPLEETTRLYESIKANQVVDRQPPTTVREQSSPNGGPSSTYPLVGRSTEWEALHTAYTTIRADGRLIVLEGEAGIGKTRLAEAYLDHLREQGAAILMARCYAGEFNLAYGPFVEALRAALSQPSLTTRLERLDPQALTEAARLLPELARLHPGLAPASPLDGPGAQSRFFEGVAQVLLALGDGLPAVVFLDDLQWADEASLSLLTYLARRLRGHSLCLLVTWRGEDVPPDHRLRQLLAEAHRAGTGHLLTLSRLNLLAVKELAQAALKSTEQLERLYRETEGLPLFVIEYLKTLTTSAENDSAWTMPMEVRSLLLTRLTGVDEASRQLLGAAAVIGRSFEVGTLQAASGRSDEETIAGLETLLAHGLVREVRDEEQTPTYDFSHDKLRALVYDETSLARRRLLHRRVAETLIGQARGRPPSGALAGQVAFHYRLAGQNPEAAHYYQLAGDHARALYANAEALAHFRSALALGHPEASALHEAIGDLLTLAGDYEAALASYESAAALGSRHALAELEHKLGVVYARRGDSELAERHFQNALAGFGEDGRAGARARVLADWSLTAHHRGQTEHALGLARQSLTLAETTDDRRALAQARNILGILASHQQDLPTAQTHLEHSLALAEVLGDVSVQVAALNNLALVLAENDQTADAIQVTERALALCASQGDRHREAALHNHLADLLHIVGQTEAAMTHLKQAVMLFAQVGKDASITQPEIWKLTEW